jgi:hypothetical protein
MWRDREQIRIGVSEGNEGEPHHPTYYEHMITICNLNLEKACPVVLPITVLTFLGKRALRLFIDEKC